MTAANPIRERIRNLLAKAARTESENEKASCLALAAALMAKHQLEVTLDEEEATIRGDYFSDDYDQSWHIMVAEAAAYLYTCRLVYHGTKKYGYKFSFVGKPDALDACRATLDYFVGEVERLYKVNLQRGLSKTERAEVRRTFKAACAVTIRARAYHLLKTMARDDAVAQETTGSTALVVQAKQKQLFDEADALLKGTVRTVAVRQAGVGAGTGAGIAAGATVKLQNAVGPKRLQIEHKG